MGIFDFFQEKEHIKKENQNLKQENKNLKIEIQKKEKSNDFLKEIISNRDNEIAKLKSKNEDHIKKYNKLQAEKKRLNNNIAELEFTEKKQMTDIKKQLSEYEKWFNIFGINIVPQDEQYKKIKNFIKRGKNIFITGGAGVGKSYIIKNLVKDFENIAITALTGVAAVNIQGITINTFCGIGLANKPIYKVLEELNKEDKKWLKKSIIDTRYLVIDEISMCSMYLLEYIDELFRNIRDCEDDFGGIQVIAVGDFYQLPPIIRTKEECPYINVCNCNYSEKEQNKCEKRDFCFNSKLFKNFQVINLTEVKRQNNLVFSSILNKMRVGEDIDKIAEYFKEKICDEKEIDTIDAIRLYGKNIECKNFNDKKFEELKGKPFTYTSIDRFEPKDNYSGKEKTESEITEILNNHLERTPKTIKLKKDCKVMLTCNIDVGAGLCNGATGIIKELSEKEVIVKFDNIDKDIQINKVEQKIETVEGDYIRKQIPLMLAYAITIHKSQGLTFNKCIINLDNIFAKGQAYVAFSRCTSIDNLFLFKYGKSNQTLKEVISVSDKVKKYYQDCKMK